jgi:SAM-dependent methyltransferase
LVFIMQEPTFRPIRDGDWPAILDLAHRSLSELPSVPRQDEWLRNRQSFSSLDGYQHHFVAALAEHVVGYASAERRNDSTEDVYRLFVVVAPSDRTSLGTRLFEKLRERLLGLGACRAWMIELAADRGFISYLESLGFVGVNSVGLPDGTTAVRLVMDAPFRAGTTGAAAIINQGAGSRFASRRVAENYRFRPPYSNEVFETLLGLFEVRPRILLDAGCGPGKITLGLIDELDSADAVDPSAEMLRIARSLPKGDSPKIRWIQSTMEDAVLEPPYGLVVAGMSIHWMDISWVVQKFATALTPGAFLALVSGDGPVEAPWQDEERTFMVDFIYKVSGKHPSGWRGTREQLNDPLLLHSRFEPVGHKITSPMPVSQTIADYLRCEHSRASWSEDHLGDKLSAEFDSAMTKLLRPYARDGRLHFTVQTRIEWGHLKTF